ncbi:hypothetical protein QA601_01875 [Chitinispirillales bacterium ANBcel5]|uniref:hypothetical protein n=1 Tax=Cellulosispirillum alkaliphilum TaxID=3039283 RepID=UPI002A516BF5|nr:hypothetical protein [Chitinispirillales bacterium ANBcel5]
MSQEMIQLFVGILSGAAGASVFWTLGCVIRGKKRTKISKQKNEIASEIGETLADAEALARDYRCASIDFNLFKEELKKKLTQANSMVKTNMYQLDVFLVKYAESVINDMEGLLCGQDITAAPAVKSSAASEAAVELSQETFQDINSATAQQDAADQIDPEPKAMDQEKSEIEIPVEKTALSGNEPEMMETGLFYTGDKAPQTEEKQTREPESIALSPRNTFNLDDDESDEIKTETEFLTSVNSSQSETPEQPIADDEDEFDFEVNINPDEAETTTAEIEPKSEAEDVEDKQPQEQQPEESFEQFQSYDSPQFSSDSEFEQFEAQLNDSQDDTEKSETEKTVSSGNSPETEEVEYTCNPFSDLKQKIAEKTEEQNTPAPVQEDDEEDEEDEFCLETLIDMDPAQLSAAAQNKDEAAKVQEEKAEPDLSASVQHDTIQDFNETISFEIQRDPEPGDEPVQNREPQGGQFPPPHGGQFPPPHGGQFPPPHGGQFPPPHGGQFPPPHGGQFPPPHGGQFPPPHGGQFPPPHGGQFPPPHGGQFPPPHGGQFPPQGRQVPPQGGQVPPQGRQVPPQGRQVPPQGRQVPPQGRQVPPQGRQVPPQGRQVPPQGRQVPPQGRQVPPQGRQVPPQGGQVPPQGGQVPPQGGQAAANQQAPKQKSVETEKKADSNSKDDKSISGNDVMDQMDSFFKL